MVSLKLSWVEGADQEVALPSYETPGAAGADVRANLPDRGGRCSGTRSEGVDPDGGVAHGNSAWV